MTKELHKIIIQSRLPQTQRTLMYIITSLHGTCLCIYLFCLHRQGHFDYRLNGTFMTLKHKSSHKQHGSICSNSQQYTVWVKMINFSFKNWFCGPGLHIFVCIWQTLLFQATSFAFNMNLINSCIFMTLAQQYETFSKLYSV